MKKSSLSQNSIRIILVFAICILFSLPAIHLVQADAAPPPDPTVGGVGPYQPRKTNVQMMAETVIITVPQYIEGAQYVGGVSDQISVSASFTMQNQGRAEEKMQVIFPLTRLNYDLDMESDYSVDPSSFIAFVNGIPVPTTEITTPAEKGYQLEWEHGAVPSGGFNPDVHWAAFEVTFPVHQQVLLQVTYRMNGYSGFGGISYILETGAGWYGNILSADLILRFPYEATSETILSANPGYSFSGNEMSWKLINFEPTRESDLDVHIIPPGDWQEVLELRARVESHPQDADGWYKLGSKYINLGFWDSPGGIMVRNQHLVDLSIQAFEKTIALRPNWGKPHYGLAFALWYSNPAISKRWDKPAQVPTLDDPIIQRVINELKSAETEVTTAGGDNFSYDYFDYDNVITHINNVFPDLKFPTPASAPPTPSPTPMPIMGTSQQATAIAAGYFHTCVLTQDGQVKCQGGYGSVYMDSLSDNDIAVVAGKGFTCVLTVQKTVKCKGINTFGQLGDGTVIYRQTFVDVIGLGGEVANLAAGDNHACALFTNGGVKCWGRNNYGQLGDGTNVYSSVPVQVYNLTTGVTSLAAGDNYTCAILSVGKVQCWGANESGQLGDGSLVNQFKPVDVVGLPQGITALAAGFAHTCALTSQGELLCWGNNDRGQLGDDHAINHFQPSPVLGLEHNVKTVVAGDQFTCVLTAEGKVKCWGYNSQGQIGDGTDTDQSSPADVVGLSGTAIILAAGNRHVCAAMQSGQVKCWGGYSFGVDETKSLESGYLVPSIRLTPVNAIELSVQSTITPTIAPNITPVVSAETPTPLQASPSSAHSPTTYMIIAFGLLIVFCVIVFILWRSKFGSNK